MPDSIVTVGLDMSLSSTGFCLKDGANLRIETIKTAPKDFPNNIERFKFIIAETIKRIPPTTSLICVEDYFTPGNPAQIGAAIKLVGLGTLIRVAMYDAKLPFFVVSPSQLKKYVTGNGKAQKSLIIKEVYKKWAIDVKDDNQADAAVLANIADSILHTHANDAYADALLKPQKEVVNTVIKDRPCYNVPWNTKSDAEGEEAE